jgi:beta-phosphoglucomutase-like phosphatase (HAD superfamily)
MSEILIPVEKNLLIKFAEFTKLAINELRQLKAERKALLQKEASAEEQNEKYYEAVTKVANALYNSDLEFITGDFDRRKFIKRAIDDHTYLARTFEKVCNAADVALIGKPARVAANRKQAIYDPVYERAFGKSHDDYSLMDMDE